MGRFGVFAPRCFDVSVGVVKGGIARRSLRRDTEGLSTTEYVLLLMVVACVGIAGWKLFGTSAVERASEASGNVGQLGQSIDGPGGGGGAGGRGGGSASGQPHSHLDDATADATPPPDPKDELSMPVVLLVGAVLLLVAMAANRMKKGDGAKGGEAKGKH